MKTCNICKEEKSNDSFYKRKSVKKDGLDYVCKTCANIKHKDYISNHKDKISSYRKVWRVKNLSSIKEQTLVRNFGITLEQYNEMFVEQGGCCAVCGKHQTELNKALAVDHNHITGKVRQLLCGNCNTSLGLMNEDVILFEKLIKYVNKHQDI